MPKGGYCANPTLHPSRSTCPAVSFPVAAPSEHAAHRVEAAERMGDEAILF